MVKYSALFLIALLNAPCAHAGTRWPADVGKFIHARDTCDHFRGELPDPDQVQRMKEVSKQLAKFCTGTDEKLASLKRKYARNALVTKQLDSYEPDIEPQRKNR